MSDEYNRLIKTDNLLGAWGRFSSGKADKEEVINFWINLENNLFNLHKKLRNGNYQHGSYKKFIVYDPKRRMIHKPRARDRIVHQLLFDYLQPVFEKRFIYDSYASRTGKGTHKAVKRLRLFCRIVGRNNTRPCWVLKCDISKFFDSIDHRILFSFIKKQIESQKILNLIWKIIRSFEISPGKGLPLGNLTSQLFANIYLQEFDYFVKNILRIKSYIRFNDDFVIVSDDKEFLKSKIILTQNFLKEKLLLSLPNKKISLRKLSWGVDFLGYIVLPHNILLRIKTRKRLLRRIEERQKDYQSGKISFAKLAQTINSYFGILKHCSSFKLRQKILSLVGNKLL